MVEDDAYAEWAAIAPAVSTRFENFGDLVATYTDEGYTGMTLDAERNAAYARGLRSAATAASLDRVLEIGPGADAVLTRLLLRAAPPSTRVLAVEANAGAAARAAEQLRGSSGVTVLHAFSSDARLTPDLAAGAFTAILHEVLGYVASREGALAILHDVLRRCPPSRVPCVLPGSFGTFYAPAYVPTRLARRCRVVIPGDQERVALVSRLPFDACAAAPWWPLHVGCLEWYHGSEGILAWGRGTPQQVRSAEFAVAASTRINCLAGFIWAGFAAAPPRTDDVRASAPTSAPTSPRTRTSARLSGAAAAEAMLPRCADADVRAHDGVFSAAFASALGLPGARAASAWRNPLFMLPCTWVLEGGDSLRVETTVSYAPGRLLPCYVLDVQHVRGSTVMDTARVCVH